MDLNESIKQVLQDSDVKNAIKEQIDSITESKSNEKVKTLLEEKTNELNEQCESFKRELTNESQRVLNEKLDDLNEHCEVYKIQIRESVEKEYNKKYKKFVKDMNESLSKYVDEVVEEFLNKHKEAFIVHENQMKTNAILEALSAVCAVAGVRAEQITEGVNYLNNKQEVIEDQRVQNLKSKIKLVESDNEDLEQQVKEQEQEIQNLNDTLKDSEQKYIDTQSECKESIKELQKKNGVLEDTLKDFVRKNKTNESELEDTKNELQDVKESLKESLSQIKELKESLRVSEQEKSKLVESVKHLKTTNESLNKENGKILKMGVISEMKQGMTLVEARRFEQIADQIPFEQTKSYFDKLDALKEELLNNPKYKKLNEVTGNEESDNESHEDSILKWDHLV